MEKILVRSDLGIWVVDIVNRDRDFLDRGLSVEILDDDFVVPSGAIWEAGQSRESLTVDMRRDSRVKNFWEDDDDLVVVLDLAWEFEGEGVLGSFTFIPWNEIKMIHIDSHYTEFKKINPVRQFTEKTQEKHTMFTKSMVEATVGA